ncbi:hypothetical protein SMF913_28910 [Streptomyces malaysiensis]|uniref:Uncharacterized protein n=1 Tax=Streptomyces malaysiensis TaxID=92644 RepID=A0A2J7YZJ5_STRMQ|nr:hypothetical protein SMF913_28910 [Streptomyces malaysiensis]
MLQRVSDPLVARCLQDHDEALVVPVEAGVLEHDQGVV